MSINKIFFFFVVFIFSFSNAVCQEAEAPKIDTADASEAIVKNGNIKCDSAMVHLQNRIKKERINFTRKQLKNIKKP
jgi:hypothetical protein